MKRFWEGIAGIDDIYVSSFEVSFFLEMIFGSS